MNMKKLTSLVLTLLLVLAMAAPAFAGGVTGTITINNAADGTAAAGRTFKAYKILDVTLSGTSPAYHVPAAMLPWYTSHFSLTADELSTPGKTDAAVVARIEAMRTNNAAMELFAQDALAAAKTAGITPETIGPVTMSATVPYGYYVIEQTSPAPTGGRVSAVMIDTTNPDAVIALKADTPGIIKAIVVAGPPASDKDADDVAVGDEVNYKITGKVPSMTGFETQYYYTVTDTLSGGLTYADSLVVKLDKGSGLVALVEGDDTGADDYHVVITGPAALGDPTNIRIIFHDFLDYKALAGNAIEITYKAILNEKAVVGEAGNPNTANLIYSNNPGKEGTPTTDDNPPDDDTVVGKTPDQKTLTFTTAIELTKVDAAAPATKLAGAKFKLEGTAMNKVLVYGDVYTANVSGTYYKLLAGTYTTTAPTAGTAHLYETPTTLYIKENKLTVQETPLAVAAEGWTGADGILKFAGLSAGTYTLTELVSPLGYNLLTTPLTITIGVTLPATVTTGLETATWTATLSSGTATVDAGIIKITIGNNKGVELPGTGGIGTTLFTIGGIVLMGAAVLLLVMRRKKQTKA